MIADKIVLLGYMGSGKSTIGRVLAQKMKYRFIDLDDYIEEKEGLSIAEIFNTKGEIYFRKKEHLYLKEVLGKNEALILALGGGTPCFAGNMEVIGKNNTVSLYLKVSIPALVKRLRTEKANRPLIGHIESDELLTEYIGKHLFERSYYYNMAQYTIDISEATIEESIHKIMDVL